MELSLGQMRKVLVYFEIEGGGNSDNTGFVRFFSGNR